MQRPGCAEVCKLADVVVVTLHRTAAGGPVCLADLRTDVWGRLH
ncbi:hypothetical protein [Dactylosporangium fulvum]|uniref:Uncharacterized protein n=1 Tax=Dactylosporangium fulvum TaxID=53359 RepID=A0ABY5WCZ9_9ACTN|nr:hypothetical protein [Dactylosporangium fulvum]UWP86638.1 hypothetical protein Dfulv_21325 [Dactylosporangium fulvum]